MGKMQGSGTLANGEHNRLNFVRVFFALFRHQRSGRLEVRFGRKARQILLLGGEPISYLSDLPEDNLSRTLVNAGLVPPKQMAWIKDKLSKGESLEEALIMAGAIAAKELGEHKNNRVKLGIGSPLQWGAGEWSFSPRPTLQVDRIDPKLRPQIDSLSAVWHAVEHHVSMDAVFPMVSDPSAGDVLIDPICPALFPSFQVDEALSALPEAIGAGESVENIFRKVPDSSGNLVKLLWFLEAAGLVHRSGRTADTTIEDAIEKAYTAPRARMAAQPKRAASKAIPNTSRPAPTSQKRANTSAAAAKPAATTPRLSAPTDEMLQHDYEKRIGRDFYAFLGLPAGSPVPSIDKKCKGLARRWRAAKAERKLPPDMLSKVDAMLNGVQLVWRTLTDSTHRAEYDKRLSQGRAPTVDDLRAKRPSRDKPAPRPAKAQPEPESDLGRARALIARGRWSQALQMLKQARLEDPSSPDVMAALGWTTWNLRGDKGGDAEEFLKLALTFDPRHASGLEWLARIKVEKNELESAKRLLQQLIKVGDDPRWAQTALRNLSRGGAR